MHLLLLDAPFLVIPADYQGRPLVTGVANSGDATLQRYSISSGVARLEGVLRHLFALRLIRDLMPSTIKLCFPID